MDKSELQELSARIDDRIRGMGIEGATRMLRVFDLISASFAKEADRPSVLVHGNGNNLAVLSINTHDLDMVGILATAYTQMHDTFIGNKPEPGEIH